MSNNKRSAIYSHYIDDETDPESYLCRHCHNLTRSGGGTSNLHKHLLRYHPDVDKNSTYGGEDVSTLDGTTIQYHEVADEEYQETLTVNGTEETIIEPVAKRLIKVRVATPLKAKKAKQVVTHSKVLEPEVIPIDESATKPTQVFATRVLRRMKRINMDHADIHNQLLQQQFENQNMMTMIEDLQREVNLLRTTRPGTYAEEEDVTTLRLYRMQQVDDLEERILNEPEFRSSLAMIFKAGQGDKMDSILSWFSNEILVQFTTASDADSLSTRRCTDFSEIFKLMFSVWRTDGFNHRDFTSVIISTLDAASSQIAAENQETNNRKRKAISAFFESDEEDKKMTIQSHD